MNATVPRLPAAGAYAVLGGARLQLRQLRRSPGQLLILITSPLFTMMFLSIGMYADSPAVITAAVLAPGLMSLWLLAVGLCGGLVNGDRWSGTLEVALVAPAPLLFSVIGRISATLVLAVLSIAESVLVARFGFGVALTLHHPVLLVAATVLTLLAMIGTASLFSALFVLSRVALLFQNALTYPFYILGGILVPVAVLPDWLEPFSRFVFLYWSGELLRSCFTVAGPVPGWPAQLAAIAGLTVAALVTAALLINHIAVRVARTGSAGLS